jgi:antitoxin (DNA-binding transcriptional repressor) of toxin-antitoxin stability system
MATISASDAESRLPELLDRVSRGEEIVVTRGDHPIARPVPERRHGPERVRQAVENLRALRQDMARRGFEPLTDEEILSAIREGRRY